MQRSLPYTATVCTLVVILLSSCVHHSHQEGSHGHSKKNQLEGSSFGSVGDKGPDHDHHHQDEHGGHHHHEDSVGHEHEDSADHFDDLEHHEDEEDYTDVQHGHSHHGGRKSYHEVTASVWLAASGAVLVISLCGILGVMVIPLMQKVFYQHLIQFLVALAVGTLSGDALLHLFPHALMMGMELSHAQHEAYHRQAVWRGFTALAALIGFFVLEKIINAMGEVVERRRREQKRHHRLSSRKGATNGELAPTLGSAPSNDLDEAEEPRKIELVRSGHAPSEKVVGGTVCMNKYSNYCVSDVEGNEVRIANGGRGSNSGHRERLHSQLLKTKSLEPPASSEKKENTIFSVEPATTILEPSKVNGGGVDKVFLHEHEYLHHGHSHAHSHIHSKPESVSSVAWMVIFGDGIHNIADGMAIGAAFAESYISGISTSIAVICHELPHEIGDFAMLLKAGMTVKQALTYNLLSSGLAFLGMIFGLFLGNVESFSAWIFCGTAGIFLYVALVDMIPELNTGHSHPSDGSGEDSHRGGAGESRWVELVLQLSGMAVGVTIMLLIALYEHDLKSIGT